MTEAKPTASPIDNIRRDNKDGAYHCPQCDTPFTRRSNLRRHFQIHMRSAIQKCESCSEEFLTREEYQTHTLSCYSSMAWTNSTQKPFKMMQRSFVKVDTSNNPESLVAPPRIATGNFVDGSAYGAANLFPNFDSPDACFPGNYTASDFGQVMSPLSSSGSVVTANSVLSSPFDGNFGNPSSPPNTFSHRRPSTSSSSISSSSTSSSPYVNALRHPHSSCYGCYSCTGGGVDNSSWQGVPASPLPSMEEPVYTRRQVKDMIDVVSECLIETMENVLTRPQSGGMHLDSANANGQLVRSIRDDGFRQTVLSEAIPRVYYRIHTGGNPKV
ncbi:hypothetical protein GALMADRAFT_230512 [Galerina marginata CBS 339.88]|uniref:C2H2-type domain-containing protein n=1 Tax=Galerina marginata (strain CBS 339.88) TaxID=685588 RepID=A0A067SIP2_GALM3|nr:hypothetical protein GALMADRAFT_230512 [Galerina marginata CBS 339.88]